MGRRGAGALAAALVALAVPAAAHGFVDRTFQTPSKHIKCAYIGNSARSAVIRCDLWQLNDVGYTVGPRGKGRRLHITDTVGDPKAPVLRYGTSRRFGRYTCTSRTSGLTCRNRATGHGFFVSSQRQRTF
jgi:hypothetical protein